MHSLWYKIICIISLDFEITIIFIFIKIHSHPFTLALTSSMCLCLAVVLCKIFHSSWSWHSATTLFWNLGGASIQKVVCAKLLNHKAHTTLGILHCSLTRLLFFTESSSRWPVFSSLSGPLYKSPTNRNLSFSSLGLLCLSSKYVVWQLETYQIKKHITTTYRGEVRLNRVFSL